MKHCGGKHRREEAIICITVCIALLFNLDFGMNIDFLVTPQKMKVFDCFMYNGEASMLYIHLWRLYQYVDHFIISVTNKTHSGRDRKISFAPFEKEIEQFLDKITIVEVDFQHAKVNSKTQSWENEKYQRDQLVRGIEQNEPNPGDVVFVEDVDEILTRDGMERVLNNLPKDFYHLNGALTPNNFLYLFDRWSYPYVIRYRQNMPSLTETRYYSKRKVFPNKKEFLFTHCTFCFDTIEQYINKIHSSAHVEFDCFPYTDPNFIFSSHYCHRNPPFFLNENSKLNWNVTDLIPPNPKLNYLIDPNFTLDIKKTVYSEENLPFLCLEISNFAKK